VFCKTLISKDVLPYFKEIEFKLLNEEMHIKVNCENEMVGDAMALKGWNKITKNQINS
jgi:hypothetical protein